MKLIYKDVPFTEILDSNGVYFISRQGKVIKQGPNGIKLLPQKEWIATGRAKGYFGFRVTIGGKRTAHLVHRVLAETFLLNPNNKEQVDHLDNDKHNNSLDNLEWVTQSENILRSFDKGHRESSQKAKYSYEDFLKMIELEKSGLGPQAIGEHFDDTDRSRISKILRRVYYKNFWKRYDNDN